jgi:deoxyribodipyrimidine photo-lyase
MLEGLQEVQKALKDRKIKMAVRKGQPGELVTDTAKDADMVVTDEGYLKIQRKWRKEVAEKINCRMCEVTSNLIVPIEEVSGKQEYSAATLRKKITPKLDTWMKKIRHTKPDKSSLNMKFGGMDLSDVGKIVNDLDVDKGVRKTEYFTAGTKAAKSRLRDFLKNKLAGYSAGKNKPAEDWVSGLSPYLHFGQISPLYVALEVRKHIKSAKGNKGAKSADAFLEELIVRRELSYNFVYYNSNYDNYKGLPPWCRRTLNYHSSDKREYVYTLEQLENSQTHDKYWNAAQTEMVKTGKMHGYMRMYWGKKILDWTKSPEQAVEIALYLNNKYELDGRDPNGYTGVLWCFGLHDHPWAERKIFGKVRYMNAKGLERKFDMEAYLDKVKKVRKV